MKRILLAAALCVGVSGVASRGEGAPKIQFEQMVCDFGKVSGVETVSGTFKFRNAGDATLKVNQPKPSCGCTVAALKPDTLAPGQSGELAFTLNLGRYQATFDKHILVESNDPQATNVVLTLKADYIPLYSLSPFALTPSIPLGGKATNLVVALSRTDGHPLRIERLAPSQPWITARVDHGASAEDATADILVDIEPPGLARQLNESINVYAAGQTNGPVTAILIAGRLEGELALSPEAFYWSIADTAKITPGNPDSWLPLRISIRSRSGKEFALTNVASTLAGVSVELVVKEPGRLYELAARLTDAPKQTASGSVAFETSLAAQPRVEVPVIVNVFRTSPPPRPGIQ